jgi:hypothetical protein
MELSNQNSMMFGLAAGLSACTGFGCSRFCNAVRGLSLFASTGKQNQVAACNRVPLQSLPDRSVQLSGQIPGWLFSFKQFVTSIQNNY